jgi:secernin
MCDTLVALENSTQDGSVIFGKNSDRPNDEVQLITYNPRTTYSKREKLKCTHISIPQVSETYAVLLSQPWWMWGAEMGVNEFGVVIGNEAVHTHEPLKEIGLLGMDLLRLGLERGNSARKSLDIITNLLEKYGQGGGCAFNDSSWVYHNSFIIADPNEAYVLETADNWWIVEKVKNVRSISNSLSIRGKGDIRRRGIIQHAINKEYCNDDNDFDFIYTFSGFHASSKPTPYSREGRSILLLNENAGNITPQMMTGFLRDHQAGICMHGGFESTGSQVSHLRKEKHSFHWFTGSTLPCISIYKPYVFPIEGQKYYDPAPYPNIDPNWFWCKHTVSKSILMESNLKNTENYRITKANSIINQENKLSNEEFMEKIKLLNLEAWDKSYEMIL